MSKLELSKGSSGIGPPISSMLCRPASSGASGLLEEICAVSLVGIVGLNRILLLSHSKYRSHTEPFLCLAIIRHIGVALLLASNSPSVKNATISASCSIAPDSLKSESLGVLSSLFYILLDICERIITGNFSSLARSLTKRDMSLTCSSLLFLESLGDISCK